jgi:DUF4097 and DUF4098 domain-containing protein YvlB
MKRILLVIVLVVLAAIAGVVVRSSSSDGTVAGIREIVSQNNAGDAGETIKETFQLSPGARVEVAGINGFVKIETSDTRTAEVHIERTASNPEALKRRRITVQADANSLVIRSEKGRSSFFARLFGSRASETVTLKLPRQVSLFAKGINGALNVGELDGSVEVAGINGRVQIASAAGRAGFKGVNGNIVVGIKRLEQDGIELSGVNGNIELQLGADVNADLETKGMNGRVISELPNVTIDKSKHGSYWARIGTGGTGITAKGINGNIRLIRAVETTATTATGR